MDIPPIQRFMTPVPITVTTDTPISEAIRLLDKHPIRHLPVTEGGRVSGLVSQRDLQVAASAQPTLTGLKVRSIMSVPVYTVSPSAPVDTVCWTMARQKHGCAVIVDGSGKALGVFTTVDALDVLAHLLQDNRAKIDLTDCVWP